MTVGIDSIGIGTPIYALMNLGVEFQYEFASDIDPNAQRMVLANLNPRQFYGDIGDRNNELAPDCDLYVAGFPCQPFSVAGLHQGLDDVKGRGKVIEHICSYLEAKTPRAFLLENVAALSTMDEGKTLQDILFRLSNNGECFVTWEILNLEEHGIPQHRPRPYAESARTHYPWTSTGLGQSENKESNNFLILVALPLPLTVCLRKRLRMQEQLLKTP